MLTQCPNCRTTFRVTSEILRVAHGLVRCGRCHTQFDALERLIEEQAKQAPDTEPGNEPAESVSAAPPPPFAIAVEESPAQESITLEGRRIEITGTYRTVGDPDQPQFHREVTEEWVTLDDDSDEHSPRASTEEDAWPTAATTLAAATTTPALYPDPAPRDALPAEAPPRDQAEDFELLAPPRPRTKLVWKLLALPLALLLLAQVVHHYRAELARHPRLGEPTLRLYGALGLPLTPDWNLHAYEIKQWGVLSDPTKPGTLKVRASITNRADFAQPYPLLKLVLEDRWGEQVRSREFEPAEYLDPGVAATRLLGPRQPVNASIVIADPGPDAEGFRFDACLRGDAGLVCATDVPE